MELLIRFAINFDDKISLEFGNKMKYRIPTSVQKLENKMYLRNNQIGKKTNFFLWDKIPTINLKMKMKKKKFQGKT